MRTLDFTPYRRATVGFDRLFDFLESGARGDAQENYPPFDIERLGADRFRITLAVAGFAEDDLDITSHQNMLVIKGRKAERDEDKQRRFVHLGIANRAFERRFELADFVRVEGAGLKDGLLTVELAREVPEALKPRKINLATGRSEPVWIEGSNENQARADQVAA